MEQELLRLNFEEEYLRLKKYFFLSLMIIYLLSSLIGVVQVKGRSMENTIKDGDTFLLNKVAYMFNEVQRGDVIVIDGENIYKEDKRQTLIKRVIGLPGEVLFINQGKVYIDGERLNEKYIKEKMEVRDFYYEIPEDEFFVMGDNRNNSLDSRIFGGIMKGNILGKVFIRDKYE